MSNSDNTEPGRCLCGAIQFEAVGKPLWVAHCHCHSCRRNTGAAVATFVGLTGEQFNYTTGAPRVFNSSPGVRRSFCGDCGTPLTYEADHHPGEVHVHISTFDRPEAFPPRLHVYFADAIPWLHLDDHLPRHDALSQ
jgi:hypothetical protein